MTNITKYYICSQCVNCEFCDYLRDLCALAELSFRNLSDEPATVESKCIATVKGSQCDAYHSHSPNERFSSDFKCMFKDLNFSLKLPEQSMEFLWITKYLRDIYFLK